MDLLDHLMTEHRAADQKLGRLAQTTQGDERRNLLAELSDALAVHMEVEERDVYPLVEQYLGEARATEAENEHAEAREDLAKAADTVDGAGFLDVVAKLANDLHHHIEEEESQVFPQLRQKAPRDVAALGDPQDAEAEAKAELNN